MRSDEFPEIKELQFKIDDEDNFFVNIEQAFMIQKRILLFNVIRKLILNKEGKLVDSHIEELIALLDDDEHR